MLTLAGFAGFWLLFMGFLCFVYLICSVRTNIVFFLIFLCLVLAFSLLTGAYWALAKDYAGNAAYAHKLVVVRINTLLLRLDLCVLFRMD